MGYGSNYAETIEEKSVKKICPKEFKNFMQALDESHEDLECFASSINNGDCAEDLETGQAYEALCKALKKATGLTTELGFHDADECGDKYDDINGHFWWIDADEIWQLTPEAKKLEDAGHKIERQFYVSFG